MPKVGFEPTRSYEHCALNTACLPVSPLRLEINIRLLGYKGKYYFKFLLQDKSAADIFLKRCRRIRNKFG
jgi:hypothetical protein